MSGRRRAPRAWRAVRRRRQRGAGGASWSGSRKETSAHGGGMESGRVEDGVVADLIQRRLHVERDGAEAVRRVWRNGHRGEEEDGEDIPRPERAAESDDRPDPVLANEILPRN